jgi:hypothetical protein
MLLKPGSLPEGFSRERAARTPRSSKAAPRAALSRGRVKNGSRIWTTPAILGLMPVATDAMAGHRGQSKISPFKMGHFPGFRAADLNRA